MKNFYKVLVSLRSCSVSIPECETKYELNKWVKSPLKDTPLFVFSTLEDAIRFSEGQTGRGTYAKNGSAEIYACEVKRPRKAPKTICSNLGFADWYWECKKGKSAYWRKGVNLSTSPEGSYVCDSVKITKLVHYTHKSS